MINNAWKRNFFYSKARKKVVVLIENYNNFTYLPLKYFCCIKNKNRRTVLTSAVEDIKYARFCFKHNIASIRLKLISTEILLCDLPLRWCITCKVLFSKMCLERISAFIFWIHDMYPEWGKTWPCVWIECWKRYPWLGFIEPKNGTLTRVTSPYLTPRDYQMLIICIYCHPDPFSFLSKFQFQSFFFFYIHVFFY